MCGEYMFFEKQKKKKNNWSDQHNTKNDEKKKKKVDTVYNDSSLHDQKLHAQHRTFEDIFFSCNTTDARRDFMENVPDAEDSSRLGMAYLR